MDDWHRKETNFKGGHLVYRIDPGMSGVFPDPVTDPALHPSLAQKNDKFSDMVVDKDDPEKRVVRVGEHMDFWHE